MSPKPSELGKLCQTCIRVFRGPPLVEARVYPGATLFGRGYTDSVDPLSCCFCLFICDYLASRKTKSKPSSELLEIRFSIALHDDVRVYIFFNFEHTQEAIVFNATPSLFAMKEWTTALPSHTLSDASMAFLKTQMSECVNYHTHERERNSMQWYPKRLLNISRSDPLQVYLEDSSQLTTGHYFTLSHCWGGHQPLQLTTQTEKSLKAGVPLGTFPKTFRDAIYLCRQFHVPYLWIDSLCILQDDISDWHREAVVMRDVYTFAQCNIAATGASNSNIGLDFVRSRETQLPFWATVEWDWLEDSPLGTWSTRRNGTYLIFPPNRSVSDLEYGPLNQRAWVLQERFLSERIMHFTASQVFWECRDVRASEVFQDHLPTGADSGTMTGTQHTLKQMLLRKPANLTSSTWKEEIYIAWQQLIVAYSRCELTFQSDKLVAIAGIAQDVALKTEDEFVCGLWRKHLLQELLWRRGPRNTPAVATSTQEWRAPTWSWASTAFQINPSHFTYHRHCRKRYDTAEIAELLSHSPESGQIKSAKLSLRGNMLRVTLTHPSPQQEDYQLSFQDATNDETFADRSHFRTFIDYPAATLSSSEKVTCIALYKCHCHNYPVEMGGSGSSLEALIVRRSEQDADLYERIGVLWMSKSGFDFFETFETEHKETIAII